jgi:hypothetical protein
VTDLRRRASDRADYLAYLARSGKKVTQAVWDAQKAFLETKYGEATKLESALDPLVTVDADGLAIEVFSRDESVYARLHLKSGRAYHASRTSSGTTHLEITPELLKSIGRMRSYRASTIEIAPSTGGTDEIRSVPYRWLRSFGQVQAASTLPAESFSLAPIDLYNVLLQLRLKKAKKPPRALRYELVPGEAPRIVLEPWDLMLEATSGPYRGAHPAVVRTFGRNRLNALARILPHAKSIRVHLVGAGLPAYYAIDFEDGTLVAALSGWTEAGWGAALSFDLLVPQNPDAKLAAEIVRTLEAGGRTLEDLGTMAPDRVRLRQALLLAMQQGLVLHDVATQTFRARSLTERPLDAERLRYGSTREAEAHRLLERPEEVRLVRIHDLGSEGTSIEGEIDDQRAHRTYRTSFTIDREGRTSKASCTCPPFRRSGVREGPCVHMIALRVKHAREQAALERARGTPEGRKLIRAETRTFIRREKARSMLYRISLDDRRLTVRWGEHPDALRMERIFFSSADEARDEYFARLADLAERRFIDASRGEQI